MKKAWADYSDDDEPEVPLVPTVQPKSPTQQGIEKYIPIHRRSTTQQGPTQPPRNPTKKK